MSSNKNVQDQKKTTTKKPTIKPKPANNATGSRIPIPVTNTKKGLPKHGATKDPSPGHSRKAGNSVTTMKPVRKDVSVSASSSLEIMPMEHPTVRRRYDDFA